MSTDTQQPISIYLRPDQLEALQALTAERGVSRDELIRQGVDALLQTEASAGQEPAQPSASLRDIIGIFRSGVGDLSVNHDQYLTETIEAESQQWPQRSS